jgi:hypothetical protein
VIVLYEILSVTASINILKNLTDELLDINKIIVVDEEDERVGR